MTDEQTAEAVETPPPEAAPPAEAPAAEAAPPPPVAEPEPPPAPVDTRASRALAKALEQSAAARRKSQELQTQRAAWEAEVKAREEQINARAADAAKWQTIGERIKRGELDQVLPELGANPDEVYAKWTQRMLTPAEQRQVAAADPEIAEKLARIEAEQEAIRKANEEARKALESERESVRAADRRRRESEEVHGLASWVAGNADKLPWLRIAAPEHVAQVMHEKRVEHWYATAKKDAAGNVVSPGQRLDETALAGILEKEARDFIAQAERLKAAFEPSQPVASEPAVAAASEQPEAKTLTRRHARTTQAAPKRLTRDERKARAYATVRANLNR